MTKKTSKIIDNKNKLNLCVDYFESLKFKALENGIIYITDDVEDVSSEEFLLQLDEIKRMKKKEVHVVITSPGGNVFPGLSIFDSLNTFRDDGGKVTVEARGYAASMAAIILQAADVRIASKNSKILIHEVSKTSWFERETSSVATEQAAELRAVNNQLIDILATRSGQKNEDIEKLIKKTDCWLTAKEAFALNLIDKIV